MNETREEHLDPTSEISLDTVKQKSVRGVVVLTGRTFFLQLLGVVAVGFLAAYLGAYEWGVFAILNAVINFLNYFSDIGLAAALVQKKEHPSETDLRTTFFVQEALVAIIIGIVVALTPFLTLKFSLNQEGVYLLYALLFSFLLSSLKSIPSVLLERKLEFIKLTFPQILEQVVYYLVLVVLAVKGFGVTSFTVAVFVRALIGLVAVYILQPWKPGFAFSRASLTGLFKFGIPYQVNTFLAALKDDGVTIILGTLLGPVGIGFLAFAQKFARYPLTFFMDTVTKVTFPAFSRMQESKEQLARSVTRSIFFICFLVFPSLAGMVLVAPLIISIIPKYSKWEPALVALALVSINFAFAAATTQLTNLLNAIGKIKITFYLMVMWTVLTWVFVPLLANFYGVNGAAAGYAIVGASSVVAIFLAKKYVNFSLTDSVLKPAFATSVMAAVLFILRGILPGNSYTIWILVIVGISVYGVLMIALIGVSLLEDAKRSVKTIFSKN